MGRIDADKMYDIVMKWDWKNSGKDGIYYDTETQRNSITYRSNMARLADTLRKEKQYTKAEEVLDLAMEKMPIKHFGYYTLVNPIIEVYYKLDKVEKAREIWQEVAKKYQEKLRYFSSLSYEKQSDLVEEISNEIQRYRSLVDMLIYVQDDEMMQQEAETFNSYLELFEYGNQVEDAPSEQELMERLLNSEDSSDNDTLN
jgi:tetratricopeptide (TPR) repeat protein